MVVGGAGSSAIVTLGLLNMQMPGKPVSAILAAVEEEPRNPTATAAASALVSIWESFGRGSEIAVADAMTAYRSA